MRPRVNQVHHQNHLVSYGCVRACVVQGNIIQYLLQSCCTSPSCACMCTTWPFHVLDFRSQNRVPNGPSDHHDGPPSRPSFNRAGAPPPPSRAPPSLPAKSPPGSGPPKPSPPTTGTRPPSHPPGSRPHPPSFHGQRPPPPPKTETSRSVRLCVHSVTFPPAFLSQAALCASHSVCWCFSLPTQPQWPKWPSAPCTWGKRRATTPTSSG